MADLDNTMQKTTSKLTEEQRQLIEENKRKAQRKLAENKRQVNPADLSQSHAKSNSDAPPAKRARQRGKALSSGYYEYNLTDMVDTRGGFLATDNDATGDGSPDKMGNDIVKQKTIIEDIPYNMDESQNPRCKDCSTMDIDPTFFTIFGIPVCQTCKKENPDKYSLITKTEAKDDYLLTDEELRDKSILPCWERPNPRKSSWNNMMLYVREQVESYAFKRWGGEEGLDKEFYRREEEKKSRKAKKFEKNIRELRNRTRTSLWQRRDYNAKHEHDFDEPVVNPDTEETERVCRTCGIKVIFDEL
ncbi:DNA repair protein rad14 [Dispira parvispora]|uniref:DNA repair protein rad14 n=1 Tax=Dispira parvispora TaxID=1520584 RepID=A0A9W8E9R6_9FUNG|nr:DNA repair protein rad14 [Dispira parvispora]